MSSPRLGRFSGGSERIVARYAVFACLWIVGSDALLSTFKGGREYPFEVTKGLLFVLVTSILLAVLVRKREERLASLSEALALSEERYRSLFENSGLPMVLVTGRGRILKANGAAVELFAPEGADLRGRRMTSFVTSDLDDFRASLERVRKGDATRFEARFASTHIGMIEATVSGAPIWLSGRPHLLLSILDETERRRDHRSVEVNRAYLHAIIEADPAGIVATDTDGKWITWNRKLRDMWSAPNSFVEGAAVEPPRDLQSIPGMALLRDPESLVASIKRTFEDPDHVVRELVSTSEEKWFEIESHPVYGPSLDYLGRAWFTRDVTDRRRLERELQETVARYRATLDSAPIAIVTVDTDGLTTTWNKGAERTFGWTAEEALGRVPPFVGEEFLHEYRANFNRVMSGSEVRGMRVDRRNKSGAVVTLRLHTVALTHADGRRVGCLAVMEDVTEREDTARRLADAISLDSLTNLVNRRSFNSALKLLLVEAERTEEQLALLYLDIDNFKSINEAFGPKVGDCLLREFGEFLHARCRPDDLVARIGGDEFAILRRHVEEPASIAEFLQSLLSGIEDASFLREHSVQVTASAGYALYPVDASSPEEFLRAAEAANHEAKRRGRNATHAFEARLTTEARRRHTVEAGLRRALAEGGFEIHYQPQVCLHSKNVLGYEGLIRWRHPERGLLMPGEFIDIAEASGLIVPMGAWVIREVGRMCATRPNGEGVAPRFSANLSAAQFADPSLLELISATVQDNAIAAGMFELEITESMLAADPERAVGIIRSLRKLGVSVAIDDFGSGYSSLQYLKRFQVDRLKIDRGFVKDLPQDETSAAIAGAVVALGRCLGMQVIAEGVETREQADHLASMGVDEGQGWLFGRPQPADAWGLGAAAGAPLLTT